MAETGLTGEQFAALAARYAVPTIHPQREFAATGGLMSYGTNLTDGFRQVGIFAGDALRSTIRRAECPGTVVDPDVVVRINEQPADISDDPIVRQRLWPSGIDDKARRGATGGDVRSSAFDKAVNHLSLTERVGTFPTWVRLRLQLG